MNTRGRRLSIAASIRLLLTIVLLVLCPTLTLAEEASEETVPLTPDERAACDRAGDEEWSTQEEAATSDILSDDETQAFALQTRPDGLEELWQAGGRLACYATTRPERLCEEASRIQFVAEAISFSSAYDRTVTGLAALEKDRAKYALLTIMSQGPIKGAKMNDDIFSSYHAALSEQRIAAIAIFQAIAPFMRRADYQAANSGVSLPPSLDEMLGEIDDVDLACGEAS